MLSDDRRRRELVAMVQLMLCARCAAGLFALLSPLAAAAWAQQACQTQELLPADLSPRANYGNDLAADGNWLAAAAFKDDDLGLHSGSVYVYRWDGSQWIFHQKLLASDGQPGAQFGGDVSIRGNWLVAQAIFQDTTFTDDGAVYVFAFDGTQWFQFQKLLAPDAGPSHWFGSSSAIDGDVIAVGASSDDANGQDAGALYVFRFNGSQWVFEQKLLASDGQPGDLFPFNHGLAISGDRIVAATPFHDHNGAVDQGGVYIFRYDGTTWVEEAELVPSDGAAGDWFGRSVSIWGSRVVAGAPHSGGTGALYVFRFDGSTWVEEQQLVASDASPGDKMGQEVRILGDTILGGADRNDDNGINSGSAYIFRLEGGQWVEKTKLLASDGRSGDLFGDAVELLGDYAFVAATLHDDADPNGGSVYAYLWEPNDCNGNGVSDVCDIANGTSSDCNGNGVPDECDIANCPPGDPSCADCNGNGVPDGCDVDPGDPDGNGQVSDDCNANGIPDECEIGGSGILVVWTGNGDGQSWSDPNNWCPQVVPDNTASDQFNVMIGPGADVRVDISATVSMLDVDPAAVVRVDAQGGRTLTVEQPDSLTNDGSLRVVNNGNRARAAGMIVNTGMIEVVATQGSASLVPTAMGTRLTGGGTVRLNNEGTSFLGSLSATVSLINDSGHLVCGAGEIVGNFTNDGVVRADSANNALTLQGIGTQRVNNALMTAADGGILRIRGTLTQDAAGVLSVSTAGSKIIVGDPNRPDVLVSGGTIDQGAGVVRLINLATLRDLTILGGLTVPAGQTGIFEGAIENEGTIIAAGSQNAGAAVTARTVPVSFAGAGRILLKSQGAGSASVVQSVPASVPITNGPAHTIEGVGRVSAAVVNQGRILARRPTDALHTVLLLDGTATLTNAAQGRIEADSSTTLEIARPLVNKGQMTALATGVVNVNHDISTSGQIAANAGGTLNINATVTGRGVVAANGGAITISGELRADDPNGQTLRLDGTAGGTITMNSGGVLQAEGAGLLEVAFNVDGGGVGRIAAAGGTIRINASVTDAGCVEVPPNGFFAGQVQLGGSAAVQTRDVNVRSGGLLRVDAGGTLTVSPAAPGQRMTQAGGEVRIDGSLGTTAASDPNAVLIQGGTFGGTGTVLANVHLTAGTLDPGSDPNQAGMLSVAGDVRAEASATWHFGLAELSQDFVSVTGSGQVQLGGTLEVVLIGGFAPPDGAEFVLLTTADPNGVGGAFDSVLLPGSQWTVDVQPDRVVVRAGPGGPGTCNEDITGDGQIDLADLAVLLNNFGSTGTHADGDIDGDGDIDLSDLALLLNVFGSPCP